MLPPLPHQDPALLLRTASALRDEATTARRAVDGLVQLAGPTTWEGGAPRRITGDLEQMVADARRAAEHLEAAAATAEHAASAALHAAERPS